MVPSGRLHPKQESWPHMVGWEVEGVSSEISASHSQWVSHHLLRNFGGDGSLGASQSPWSCLGTCCNSCSFAWQLAREKQEGTHEVLGNDLDLAQTKPTLLPLQSVRSNGSFQVKTKDHLRELGLGMSHTIDVFMPGTGRKQMAIAWTWPA